MLDREPTMETAMPALEEVVLLAVLEQRTLAAVAVVQVELAGLAL